MRWRAYLGLEARVWYDRAAGCLCPIQAVEGNSFCSNIAVRIVVRVDLIHPGAATILHTFRKKCMASLQTVFLPTCYHFQLQL